MIAVNHHNPSHAMCCAVMCSVVVCLAWSISIISIDNIMIYTLHFIFILVSAYSPVLPPSSSFFIFTSSFFPLYLYLHLHLSHLPRPPFSISFNFTFSFTLFPLWSPQGADQHWELLPTQAAFSLRVGSIISGFQAFPAFPQVSSHIMSSHIMSSSDHIIVYHIIVLFLVVWHRIVLHHITSYNIKSDFIISHRTILHNLTWRNTVIITLNN